MIIKKTKKYYSDGFVIGTNPSRVGGGFTVTDQSGNVLICEKVYKDGFTNNEGEILGILWCLRNCDFMDSVSTDSMCCLAWVNSGKSKSRPDMADIFIECKKLKMKKQVNLMWEGRDFNLAGLHNDFKLDRGEMYNKDRETKMIVKELPVSNKVIAGTAMELPFTPAEDQLKSMGIY